MEQTEVSLNDIQPWGEFVKRHQGNGAITRSGMATLIRHRDKNGLTESGAVIKLNNKIQIVEQLFLRWVLDQRGDQS